MASLQSLQTRLLAARGVIGQTSDDLSVAVRLRYVGTGSVTSVTVTTATNIVAITSDGGTDTYAFATYTTLGTLVDKINADGIFEARILDGIRSMASASTLVDGAITISSDGYYDVLDDTSASDRLAYRLTFDRNTPSKGAAPAIIAQHRVHLQEIKYTVTYGGGVDTNGLKVYSSGPSGLSATETLIYQITPVDATATTINWASGEGKITAAEGYDLVVVTTDATSVTGNLTVSGIAE